EHSEFGDAGSDFEWRVRLCVASTSQYPLEHVRVIHLAPTRTFPFGSAFWIPLEHFGVNPRLSLRDLDHLGLIGSLKVTRTFQADVAVGIPESGREGSFA